MASFFGELPDAVLVAIFKRADALNLLRAVALTNRRLSALATDSEVSRPRGSCRDGMNGSLHCTSPTAAVDADDRPTAAVARPSNLAPLPTDCAAVTGALAQSTATAFGCGTAWRTRHQC